ncbi:MAG: hypothetical protein A4S16_03490 [Proteobacteria bacterium SG_bin6]|nr:MAG: hypothetical protein A4S16_03490 [Proteobacteria bacterium SG_bin6]
MPLAIEVDFAHRVTGSAGFIKRHRDIDGPCPVSGLLGVERDDRGLGLGDGGADIRKAAGWPQ